MGYRYLLFLDQDQVMVIHYEERNGKKLQYITNQGETRFPLEEDFWTWWKAAVSYIDGEPVDFCFLYDKNYTVLKHTFPEPEESSWNRDIVEDFFREMTDYSCLLLISEDGTEVSLQKEAKMFYENKAMIFHTNIPLKKKGNAPRESGEREETPFARYFRELLKEV